MAHWLKEKRAKMNLNCNQRKLSRLLRWMAVGCRTWDVVQYGVVQIFLVQSAWRCAKAKREGGAPRNRGRTPFYRFGRCCFWGSRDARPVSERERERAQWEKPRGHKLALISNQGLLSNEGNQRPKRNHSFWSTPNVHLKIPYIWSSNAFRSWVWAARFRSTLLHW